MRRATSRWCAPTTWEDAMTSPDTRGEHVQAPAPSPAEVYPAVRKPTSVLT
ncbi:hypothetical protein DPMN_146731 [Dreissena polymorpha]|uniref:Uncharacterized protein n=1 Tax=Dreissena polymorpha TaxID=45954 RepID=A0A9D4F6G6_DREPO|nr:hypothetical protein DPMN_146731 [Dreissena polymorpha]